MPERGFSVNRGDRGLAGQFDGNNRAYPESRAFQKVGWIVNRSAFLCASRTKSHCGFLHGSALTKLGSFVYKGERFMQCNVSTNCVNRRKVCVTGPCSCIVAHVLCNIVMQRCSSSYVQNDFQAVSLAGLGVNHFNYFFNFHNFKPTTRNDCNPFRHPFYS